MYSPTSRAIAVSGFQMRLTRPLLTNIASAQIAELWKTQVLPQRGCKERVFLHEEASTGAAKMAATRLGIR